MNPHTPKGAGTLGVGIPVDSRMFRKQFQGVKTQYIEELFIPMEIY
jgi:hypothetical protein